MDGLGGGKGVVVYRVGVEKLEGYCRDVVSGGNVSDRKVIWCG